jgi:hypothetical protein
MTSPETKSVCENTVEQAIDGCSIDQNHVQNCRECRAVIATISAIKAAPVPDEVVFPALKQKVMLRLTPILKEKYSEERAVSFMQSWFFRLGIAGASLILVIAMALPWFRQVPAVTRHHSELPIVLTQVFQMSVNGGEMKEVSLDNPISLFSGEAAEIRVPDGSILKVQGPARMSVAPRGFHLASGYLTASVTSSNKAFVATTAHGQIQVLGTVFSCDSTAQKTVVTVIEGKVKIKPDHGPEKILSAGETAEMRNGKENATDSETIPSVDSE